MKGKGRHHNTHLLVKNKEAVTWESKTVSKMTSMSLLKKPQEEKSIRFVSILDIRAGHTTKVFSNAQRKGMAGNPEHCFSLITPERTLDLRAQSREQRDWLVTSFQHLVHQAQLQEKASARHVELNIIKRVQSVEILKHGRRGRPHSTLLTIHKNGELSWKGRSGGSIYLENVLELVQGNQATAVFGSAKRAPRSEHCLSLVTSERTLDIETNSEETRDWLLVAFKYLIHRCEERRQEIKRDQVERHRALHRVAIAY